MPRKRAPIPRSLRKHGAQHTGTLHPVQKNPVGKIIKLLDILTLNVDIPGAAKNIKQTSLIYAAGYDFGRKNKIMKQRSKVARRLRSLCCCRSKCSVTVISEDMSPPYGPVNDLKVNQEIAFE